MEHRSQRWLRHSAAGVMLAMATFGLAGCGDENDTVGSEQGADVQDISENDGTEENEAADSPYDAAYDQAFYDEMDSYISETVTLSAKIDNEITGRFFSIAGTGGTEVEPLLVMHSRKVPQVQEGQAVEVTGVVHKGLDVEALEENLGINLDNDAVANWSGEPYLEATEVTMLNTGS